MTGLLGLVLILNFKKMIAKKHLIVVIVLVGFLLSCSEEEDNGVLTFDAPNLSLSIESGEFRIGQTIRVTAEYEATALFREFVV